MSVAKCEEMNRLMMHATYQYYHNIYFVTHSNPYTNDSCKPVTESRLKYRGYTLIKRNSVWHYDLTLLYTST